MTQRLRPPGGCSASVGRLCGSGGRSWSSSRCSWLPGRCSDRSLALAPESDRGGTAVRAFGDDALRGAARAGLPGTGGATDSGGGRSHPENAVAAAAGRTAGRARPGRSPFPPGAELLALRAGRRHAALGAVGRRARWRRRSAGRRRARAHADRVPRGLRPSPSASAAHVAADGSQPPPTRPGRPGSTPRARRRSWAGPSCSSRTTVRIATWCPSPAPPTSTSACRQDAMDEFLAGPAAEQRADTRPAR